MIEKDTQRKKSTSGTTRPARPNIRQQNSRYGRGYSTERRYTPGQRKPSSVERTGVRTGGRVGVRSGGRAGVRTRPDPKQGRRIATGDAAGDTVVRFPDPQKDEIRMLVLGGVSEIGKNMYAIEYNNTIILLECGITFGESSTPGVEMVMPNIEYLKEKRRLVKAIVVTNSAMTHIGALPYTLSSIGSPTVYTRDATKSVIENRMKEIRKTRKISFHTMEEPESVKISDDVTLHFFGMSDAKPTTLGVLIETKAGCISYTGSLQIKHKKGVIPIEEEKRFAVHKGKNVILSIADSVNAERPGFSVNNTDIVKNIMQILQEAPYRAIIPLFPSQVKRNALIVEGALKLGKKIYVQGPALLNNLQTACESGILNVPEEALIPINEMNEENDDVRKVLIICAGGENEEYKMLEKMSQEECEHTSVITEDTVIFPSPIVPTNARMTQNLKDRLSRLGAIIHSYDTSDVKASEHPNKDELHWIHQQISPKYFVPVQGYHYMLTAHTHITRDTGVSLSSCVIPENGSVIDINPNGKTIRKHRKRMQTTPVSVDGHMPVSIQDVVLQDRKTLAQEGIFIIILFVDQKKLVLKKSPDILSRGFVYLKESRDLITRTRIMAKNATEKVMQQEKRVDINTMKKAIQKEIQSFLMNETNKKPIIIPVIFI